MQRDSDIADSGKQGRRNVGRAGRGQKKSWGQWKLMKKKIVTNYQARN